MSINIKYSNKGKNSSVNNILFCNEKFNIAGLKKDLTNSELKYIQDLLRTHDLKKNLYVFYCRAFVIPMRPFPMRHPQ